jgi:hypothetical protein
MSLENPETPVSPKQAAPNAQREADEHTSDPNPPVTPTAKKPELNPPAHKYEVTCNKQRDWIDKASFGLEAFGLFVLVIYAVATIAIWCANKKAADAAYNASVTASRQLEMADRPWLKEEVKSVSDFNFQNGTISWAVSINAQNVGHSVATETFPDARIIAIQGADLIDAPRKKVTEICEGMPKRFHSVKAVPGLWNNSIFPSDSHEFRGVNIILSPKDMEEIFDGGTGIGKSVIPVLVGCLEYHYPTSDRPHHTGFVYVLSHNEDSSIPESARAFFSVGKNIPKDNVVLRKFGQMAD